jgi:hypothetical protein
MKIIKGIVKEEFDRDLYWVRVIFLSDNETKRTQVLACVSVEYLEDINKLPGGQKLDKTHFDKWLDMVITKWFGLKEKLFEKDIHYDVYANTKEGEANGIDYLFSKHN